MLWNLILDHEIAMQGFEFDLQTNKACFSTRIHFGTLLP